jgi:hypothetical protein
MRHRNSRKGERNEVQKQQQQQQHNKKFSVDLQGKNMAEQSRKKNN